MLRCSDVDPPYHEPEGETELGNGLVFVIGEVSGVARVTGWRIAFFFTSSDGI